MSFLANNEIQGENKVKAIMIVMAILVINLIIFAGYYATQFKRINRKLNDACNPEPAIRFNRSRIKKTSSRGARLLNYQVDLANALWLKEGPRTALELLEQLNYNKVEGIMFQLSYDSTLLNAQCEMNQAEQAQATLARLQHRYSSFSTSNEEMAKLVSQNMNISLGIYEYHFGDLEKAETHIKALLGEDSNNLMRTLGHYYLGKLYEKLQEPEQATEHYKAALKHSEHLYFYEELMGKGSSL